MPFIVTFALQHGSFVPGEWIAAKGSCLSFYRTQNRGCLFSSGIDTVRAREFTWH